MELGMYWISGAYETYLDLDYKKGTILLTEDGGSELIVVRPPKKRQGWCWDFLRRITFGKYFQPIKTHYVRWEGNNIWDSPYKTKKKWKRFN